jgi:hypothetical protein
MNEKELHLITQSNTLSEAAHLKLTLTCSIAAQAL